MSDRKEDLLAFVIEHTTQCRYVCMQNELTGAPSYLKNYNTMSKDSEICYSMLDRLRTRTSNLECNLSQSSTISLGILRN